MRKALMIMGVAWLASACTEVKYVAVPVNPQLPKTPVLQACADHAADAQRSTFGDKFNGLQFDTANLVLTKPTGAVGSQQVAAVYDGDGEWYGRPYGTMGEWRKIRFHCMISPVGEVVYSFVRQE
jgi:hypothetical protein